TMLHAEPFQCSMRVVMPRPGTSSFAPTAQTLFEATAVTPRRMGLLGPVTAGGGRGGAGQGLAVECRAKPQMGAAGLLSETPAPMSLALTAVIAFRWAPAG